MNKEQELKEGIELIDKILEDVDDAIYCKGLK